MYDPVCLPLTPGTEKLKCDRERVSPGAKSKPHLIGDKEKEDSSCPSSSVQGQQEKSNVQRTAVSPPVQERSPTQVAALSKTFEKSLLSPQSQEKQNHSISAPSEILQSALLTHKEESHTKKSPSTSTGEKKDSNQERVADISKQHTVNSASCL